MGHFVYKLLSNELDLYLSELCQKSFAKSLLLTFLWYNLNKL